MNPRCYILRFSPQSFLGSTDILSVSPYKVMADILFNDAELGEQTVNIPVTEYPMCNLVKISGFRRQVV